MSIIDPVNIQVELCGSPTYQSSSGLLDAFNVEDIPPLLEVNISNSVRTNVPDGLALDLENNMVLCPLTDPVPCSGHPPVLQRYSALLSHCKVHPHRQHAAAPRRRSCTQHGARSTQGRLPPEDGGPDRWVNARVVLLRPNAHSGTDPPRQECRCCRPSSALLFSTEGQLTRLQDLGFRKEDCKRALLHCKGVSLLSTLI